jgi:hypothetical protein
MRVHECVGCGYCCLKAPCALSVRIHGYMQEKCPALIWSGTRYLCRYADHFKTELAIGAGCCSALNSWRQEVKDRG